MLSQSVMVYQTPSLLQSSIKLTTDGVGPFLVLDVIKFL